jgi:predicted Fe-S protein YdhL (DUF1289 family)
MNEVKLKPGSSASEVVSAPVKFVNAPELIAARALLVRAAAENVPSPCISVCRMDKVTDWCEGCFRTIDEIRQWSKSDDAAKRALWLHIEQRAAASVA